MNTIATGGYSHSERTQGYSHQNSTYDVSPQTGYKLAGSMLVANGAEVASIGLEAASTGVALVPGLFITGIGLAEMGFGIWAFGR